MPTTRRAILLSLPGLAAARAGLAQTAAAYPSRAVRVVIPSAPGGLTDGFVRLIGDAMQRAWGQPFVMDHRPGAGGIVGAEHVARSAPDGHTLMMGNIGPLGINPGLYPRLPYDAARDFAPISLVAVYPNVLVVNPAVPARDVAGLVALARARPGALRFASAGIGQSQHLSGEMFNVTAGVQTTHVPYRGTGPALSDVMGGHVEMMFSNLPPAVEAIRAGRLRALGVTGTARSAVLPEVPTIAEAGVPGYEVFSWIALVGPAGMPGEIIGRLHAETARVARTEEARRYYLSLGAEPRTDLSPEQAGAYMQRERDRWAELIRRADIRPE